VDETSTVGFEQPVMRSVEATTVARREEENTFRTVR
jgi:hypothetical protein